MATRSFEKFCYVKDVFKIKCFYKNLPASLMHRVLKNAFQASPVFNKSIGFIWKSLLILFKAWVLIVIYGKTKTGSFLFLSFLLSFYSLSCENARKLIRADVPRVDLLTYDLTTLKEAFCPKGGSNE